MAISKNKTEIIDKLSLEELREEIYHYNYYHYWYDIYDFEEEIVDDYDDYDYLGEEIYLEYEYRLTKTIIMPNGAFKKLIGSFIDMESAYSKSNLRKMRLEAILEGKRLPNEKVYLIDNLNQKSLDNLKKLY